MDALLLAAGYGTRLRPLTNAIPKALLPINGVCLLDLHLDRLFDLGIERVAVNTHHLAGAVEEAIRGRPDAEQILACREPEILGTGGAIAAAAPALAGDPIAVVNSDALFAPPFEEAAAFHRTGRFSATLVVVPGGPNPNVRIRKDRVQAIDRDRRDPNAHTFTGFHFVSRAAAAQIPLGRFSDVRDLYDRLIAEERLGAFVWNRGEDDPFLDVGTPRAYLEAHRIC
ncbi:MAG: NTP transferase domain-containing protein, partial [Candidatus Eisenbacteria bacterium]|nr:NTP transferase domain-containing protein [Candidatus Latescibacterota bacterium]MBD3302439.1 NTP transferase domain-containing protein [Candidatus Eisenbacteria bacterium]